MSKPASWTAREAGLPEWVVTALENLERDFASASKRSATAAAERDSDRAHFEALRESQERLVRTHRESVDEMRAERDEARASLAQAQEVIRTRDEALRHFEEVVVFDSRRALAGGANVPEVCHEKLGDVLRERAAAREERDYLDRTATRLQDTIREQERENAQLRAERDTARENYQALEKTSVKSLLAAQEWGNRHWEEVKRLKMELVVAKEENAQLLASLERANGEVQVLRAEAERLNEALFEAQQALLREGVEGDAARAEAVRLQANADRVEEALGYFPATKQWPSNVIHEIQEHRALVAGLRKTLQSLTEAAGRVNRLWDAKNEVVMLRSNYRDGIVDCSDAFHALHDALRDLGPPESRPAQGREEHGDG